MSFELPRAARALRFSGELQVPKTPPEGGADGAFGGAPAPLARPRPLTPARAAAFRPEAFPDDDESPTRVHPSALAPVATPAPVFATEPAPPRRPGPRPIPNFRPAASVSPAPAKVPSRSRRKSTTKASRQKRRALLGARSLPMLVWVCLAIIAGAISFHAAPPLATRLGLVAQR